MKLHEKVAQEIVKDISGRYEEYDTIERLENFLKNLEDLGIREVHEQLVRVAGPSAGPSVNK